MKLTQADSTYITQVDTKMQPMNSFPVERTGPEAKFCKECRKFDIEPMDVALVIHNMRAATPEMLLVFAPHLRPLVSYISTLYAKQ